MESSQFSNSQSRFESIEQLDTQGATCDAFRVKLYGKLHFLKRLRPEYVGDIRYQEVLRKEFETGYQLEHPNLVRYISLDADSILMEYVDGETLAQRLTKNPDYFSNQRHKDKFVRQLLSALQYLLWHRIH
jgi:serine/threonine protein kinase